jgi:single-stranded-DNA-specific exonuclease
MKQQLSLSQKIWEIPSSKQIFSLSELQGLLLSARGFKSHEEIQKFLEPSLEHLESPWAMNGMEEAVQRIETAIETQERIVVFGDFDTDGITATVILVRILTELGAHVSYRIPERNIDSHGLKTHLLDDLIARNVGLIITVDCGINDAHEVKYATEIGIDVIVTDHHEPDEKKFPSNAIAVLNPKRGENGNTSRELSGSAIAWKLAAAIGERMTHGNSQKLSSLLSPLMEIAAIGIIADCVELVGENRILAKFGLEKMKDTQWIGLLQLLERTDTSLEKIAEDTVGFVIAPHLNAASRLGDVFIAAQLFLGDERDHLPRIEQLLAWNKHRRALTEKAVQEAEEQIRPNAPFQLLYKETWKPGILGLLAARYSQQLGVPIIACTLRSDGKISASCRAPEPYSIINGLRTVEHCLERFGGHAGAAGFLMEQDSFPLIKEALDEYFSSLNLGILPQKIDAWISPTVLNWELLEFFKFFAPFGAGNPAPVLGLRNVKIKDIRSMGTQNNHARFVGEVDGQQLDFVAFFAGYILQKLKKGDRVDIALTVGENEWNGEKRMQLRVEDVRMI